MFHTLFFYLFATKFLLFILLYDYWNNNKIANCNDNSSLKDSIFGTDKWLMVVLESPIAMEHDGDGDGRAQDGDVNKCHLMTTNGAT